VTSIFRLGIVFYVELFDCRLEQCLFGEDRSIVYGERINSLAKAGFTVEKIDALGNEQERGNKGTAGTRS
jgi:hypothetical protein